MIAALVDLSLIGIFGLQHSVMARRGFKSWLHRLFPSAAERSTFLVGTACAVFVLCLLWRPLPWIIWQAEGPLAYVLLGSGLAGWAIVLVASFLINHFDLFGLRQGWLYFVNREYTPLNFKAIWFYRHIRHPIMTGVLMGVWFTPTMSFGHLLFACGMSAYVLIGVCYEESDLIVEFGETYRRYMRSTGRFVPMLKQRLETDGARQPGHLG